MSDISHLPPPPGMGDDPQERRSASIADLPPPPSAGARSDIAGLPPPPGKQDEYQKLQEEMNLDQIEGFRQSPWLISKTTSDQDLEVIAKKHGVDPTALRNWLPYLGGVPEKESLGDIGAEAASIGGELLLGIPQKLAKQTQSPQMIAALDDIQSLAQQRKSIGRGVIENLDVLTPAGAGKKALSKIALAGTAGAVQGATHARQGEELTGAAIGGTIGAGLGGIGAAIDSRKVARALEKTDKLQKRVEETVQAGGIDIQKAVENRVEQAADADKLIRERIFSPSKTLSEEEQAVIARTYGPESLDRRTNPETEEYAILWKKLIKQNPNITQEELAGAIEKQAVADIANETVNRQAKQLASDVGVDAAEDPIAVLRSWAGQGGGSGQGTEFATERLQRMQRTNHAVEHIASRGYTATGDSTINRLGDFLSDAQYVLRSYDEKYKGIGLEEAHKEINSGLNKMSYAREDYRSALRNLHKQARSNGWDNTAVEGTALIEKMENPKLWSAMTTNEQKAAQAFSDFFEKRLADLNVAAQKSGMAPLAIKPRLGPRGERIYVPSQLMDGYKLQDVMSDRIQSIVDAANSVTRPGTFRELRDIPTDVYNTVLTKLPNSPEHMDTIRFLRTLSKTDSDRPADLAGAFESVFLNKGGHLKLETVARAALEREDVIPMWARETNLYKLADKWGTNTLRHAYLRRGIDQLGSAGRLLSSLGAEREAKYVENLLTDISGTRRGTVAEATRSIQQAYTHKLDRWARTTKSETARNIANTLKSVPVMLQEMTKQVYPNFLGSNPRSLIMNSTQSFTKTMPEFGNAYGASLFFRGAMQSVKGGVVPGFKAALQDLEKHGLAPAKYIGGGEPYLAEGIGRSGGVQLAGNALRTMADLSMKPYGMAENANRAIAWGASKMMAHDLAGESRAAQKALNKFPTSVQRAVAAAGKDTEEVARIIGTHIINSTQYQYNRASMSEMGRTMGPLFSAFSKWPSATLGQVVEGYRTSGITKGSTRLAEQLVAPWILLEVADQVMNATMGEPTDRRNKLLSKSGLSQAAPIGNLRGYLPEGSLYGLGTGDFFSPPAVDTALKVFGSGKGPQASGITKAIDNGIYAFAPGGIGGWIRFITDDLVTLYTGRRPEGSTFLERTGSGIRKWENEF